MTRPRRTGWNAPTLANIKGPRATQHPSRSETPRTTSYRNTGDAITGRSWSDARSWRGRLRSDGLAPLLVSDRSSRCGSTGCEVAKTARGLLDAKGRASRRTGNRRPSEGYRPPRRPVHRPAAGRPPPVRVRLR
jgi:hypothetical protein